MFETLRHMLGDEIARLQNQDFLEAVMAVCALVSVSEQGMSLAERYRIDTVIAQLDELKVFAPEQTTDLLAAFAADLAETPAPTRERLHRLVRRQAGQPKRARTLARVAYAVMTAGGEIPDREREAFAAICRALNVDPGSAAANLDEPSTADDSAAR